MDYDLLFPGRFIKSADLRGKDATVTITGILTEELPQANGAPRLRGIVSFAETKKGLVLNRTNAECLKGMFGRETDVWIGKRVTLFPAPFNDPFGGDQTTCLRIRGSPDLERDTPVEVKLPRKRPATVVMKATGKKTKAAAPKASPPPAAPITTDGEPPDDVPLPGATPDDIPFGA